jgi:hypothetical protein
VGSPVFFVSTLTLYITCNVPENLENGADVAAAFLRFAFASRAQFASVDVGEAAQNL